MKRLLLPVSVVAFLVALALMPSLSHASGIPSAPFTSAEDCLACHQAGNGGPVLHTVDFRVPSVDKTRCNVCHGLAAHPPHGVAADCAGCHTSWPTTGGSLPFQSVFNAGAFGYFSSALSTSLDGPTLHAIHNRHTWAADVTSRSLGCPSCHAPASCTACHGPVAHDAHPAQGGDTLADAPTADVSPNPAGTAACDTFTAVSCASPRCHAGIGTERVTEDDDATVTVGAGWTRYDYSTAYVFFLGGTALRTTAPGSELSIPFEGDQVSIWGETGWAAGAIDIYVDGAFVAHKDLYELGTHFQNGVWMSGGLGSGHHVLRIVSGRSTNPNGPGGTTVWFDRIVSRDVVAPAGTTPLCTSCHPGRETEHGYDAVGHVAGESATVDPTLGRACGSCHSMDLKTAHASVTTSWAPDGGCGVCHGTVSANPALTAEGTLNASHVPGDWDQTCEACHNAGNPVLGADKHPNQHMHTLSPDLVTKNQACFGCHPLADPGATDLPAMHANASVTVTIGDAPTESSGCDVCHKNPALSRDANGLLSNDCSVCHFTADSHPGLSAAHTSPTITSSCQGTGCHVTDLPAVHEPYAAKNGFATSCDMCHANLERIPDISLKTAACDSCHDIGASGHIGVHVATDTVTAGCEACHALPAGGDIASLHANTAHGPCNTCHDNPDKGGDLTMSDGVRKPDAACAQPGCHAAKDPYDPGHYDPVAAEHAATESLTVDPSLGTPCGRCHYMDLRAEHTKAGSTMPDGSAVTCVKCHTSAKFAALPSNGTAIGRTWSPQTCEQCHAAKHGRMATKHDFSLVRPSCGGSSGSGCHTITDVTAIHAGATFVVGGTTLSGCAVCHRSPTTIPAGDCITCHSSVDPGHRGKSGPTSTTRAR